MDVDQQEGGGEGGQNSLPLPPSLENDLFGGDDNSNTPTPAPPPISLTADVPEAEAEAAPVAELAQADLVDDDDDDDGDDAGGLFGDDDDDDDQPASPKVPIALATDEEQEDASLTAEERAHRAALEYREGGLLDVDDDASSLPGMEGIVESKSIAQIELANFGLPHTSKVWHARLPAFVGLNSAPFDEIMWEPDDERGENGQDTSSGPSAVKAPPPDEYVIRWRWTKDADGNPVKQSNSRFVRWSDGSLSLQIGNELFDVQASIDHSAVVASAADSNQPANGHSSAKPPPKALATTTAPTEYSAYTSATAHGNQFVVTDHQYSGLLEAAASVHGSLSITPTTLQSATHRRLASSIARKYERQKAIKQLVVDKDPEREKAEREKMELDKIKKEKAKSARSRKALLATRRKRMTRFEDGEGEGYASGAIDDDDDDDDDAGAYSDAGDRRSSSRHRRVRHEATNENKYDEDDGFVVGSADEDDVEEEAEDDDEEKEEDGEEGGGEEDAEGESEERPASSGGGKQKRDQVDEMEWRAEREEKRRREAKLLNKQHREKAKTPEPVVAPRRRLVIEDDEDDE